MSAAVPTMNLALGAPSSPRVVATRLHITRRGRALLATIVAIPLVILALVIGLNGGGATASLTGASASFDYVTVSAGQSLWELSEDLAPAADPRDVIAEIMSLNQLATSDVEPGQRLAVPAKYTAAP
ncbi:LysM peptidoglycan-binding domain-containing protein [Compostimonas suwonensis]|uniref:LysM domain-containing protein n=1 Tax=Compostimonas suwonensis TaxID=1048394 RepID=A0A2M9BTP1_9MICO|nr:LysM peptidoglycan-binding domain-containing protein [Compostimonas suwonensis]PJJ61328.1 hypothetical protein CLV54_2272 [Compostimonas suwonensis]